MRERSVGVMALVGLLCFVAVAGTIFAYYFLPNPDLLLNREEAEARRNKLLHVSLHDIELLIPSNLLTRVKKRTLGGVSQIDLNIPWPFDPQAKILPPEEVTNHADQLLLTFMKAPIGPTDLERFQGIYRPYIAGAPANMQANLQRYSFSTSSPYADIEYYTGAVGDTIIYIKCELRASSLGPKLCSNSLKVSSQTVLRYRFARGHLAQWREIDKTVRQLMLQLTHRSDRESVSG